MPNPVGRPAVAESNLSTPKGGCSAVSIEMRSVNGRFLTPPAPLPDMRGLSRPQPVGAAFRRGKIELRLSTTRDADAAWPQPTPELLEPEPPEDMVQGWLANARAAIGQRSAAVGAARRRSSGSDEARRWQQHDNVSRV